MLSVATPRGHGSLRSYSLAADPDITPATIPCWPNRHTHLAHLDAWAAWPGAAEQARAAATSVPTVVQVGRYDAETADSATGRNVTTSHATVARALGLSARTVRKARSVLVSIGLARVLAVGRHLRAHERVEATATHGGRQIKAASTRAMTIPAPNSPTTPLWMKQMRGHLPRRGSVRSNPPSRRITNARAQRARVRTAAAKTKNLAAPASMSAQRLAAQLVARLPHLCPRDRHIGALAHALDRANLTQWRCTGLIAAIDARNQDLGLFALPWHRHRDPIRLFIHQAREATRDKVPPHVLEAQRRQAREAENARQRAERQRREATAVPMSANKAMQEAIAALRFSNRTRSHRPPASGVE